MLITSAVLEIWAKFYNKKKNIKENKYILRSFFMQFYANNNFGYQCFGKRPKLIYHVTQKFYLICLMFWYD